MTSPQSNQELISTFNLLVTELETLNANWRSGLSNPSEFLKTRRKLGNVLTKTSLELYERSVASESLLMLRQRHKKAAHLAYIISKTIDDGWCDSAKDWVQEPHLKRSPELRGLVGGDDPSHVRRCALQRAWNVERERVLRASVAMGEWQDLGSLPICDL